MEWLAQAGLSNALVATLLALLAAAAAPARRPALTHGLWLLVLIKLVTPPLAAVRVLPPRAEAAPAAWVEPVVEDTRGTDVDPAAEPAPDIPPAGGVPAPASAPPLAAGKPSMTPYRWFQAAWVAGALAWWGLAGGRVVRFHRLLREARPADDALLAQVHALARRMGLTRAPRVGLVPGRVPPLLWSLGRAPLLVLPEALWAGLGPEARESLLTHELAHLRRRDHRTRWLELLTGGLYWWHPVVWWARRALRDAEEQCCDAWVVAARPESARTYARALLATLDFLSEPRPATPFAASGIGHVSCLKRRMTMIVRAQTPKALSWRGRLAVFTLGATLLPLAPTWAQRDPGPKEAPPAAEADGRPREKGPRDELPVGARIEQYRRALELLGALDKNAKKQLDEAFDQMEKAFDRGKIGEGEFRSAMERMQRDVHESLERARMAQRERRGDAERPGRPTPADTPEHRAQLEKARAEVRELHDKLRQAEGRLADLEGRPGPLFRVREYSVRSRRDGADADRPPAPDGRTRPESADRQGSERPRGEKPGPRDGERRPGRPERDARPRSEEPAGQKPGAPDQRVRQLEERLDALLREMQSLKSEIRRGDAGAKQ